MAVSIRLSRIGKRNRPVFRIVAVEKRSKRNGKYLANLGTYDPNINPPLISLDNKGIEEWRKKGASISAGLVKLLKKSLEK